MTSSVLNSQPSSNQTMANNPLHTEPRAARFGEINVVRRGPVNGVVRRQVKPRDYSIVISPER